MEQSSVETALTPQEEIQEFINQYAEYAASGDIPQLMNLYTDDVIGFDLMMPFQATNKVEYRKAWEIYAQHSRFPLTYEFSEIKIHADQNLGFYTAQLHLIGSTTDNKNIDMWMRVSCGLVKEAGKWLIKHEHSSVPIEMMTGKGVFQKEDLLH